MKATILSFALILILAGCQDDDSSCNNTICTQDFRSVTVSIIDQNSEVVNLDRTETMAEDGTVLSMADGLQDDGSNRYLILHDGHLDDLTIGDNNVTFRGWLDGQVIVEQVYVISADCCHIGKTAGPDTITID